MLMKIYYTDFKIPHYTILNIAKRKEGFAHVYFVINEASGQISFSATLVWRLF